MAAQQSQTATKLTTLGVVMLIGLFSACGALLLGGSEDPPPEETSCLPSATQVANVSGSGTIAAAADEAVKAGTAQQIKVAVAVSDAGKSDDALTVGETGLMPSASVIKLAVALAAGKKVDAGTLSMGQVTPLLTPMISVSDNNATNQLVELVGGASEVNAQIRTLGVTDGQARLGRALGAQFSGADPNVLSIGGTAKMLQIIYDSYRGVGGGRKISKSSAAPIVSAMKDQQVNTKFGSVLPHDQIAHKTGELTGTSHDVGWFFDGDRWLSVAILTSTSGGDQAAGNEIIKKFAKKVFDARKEPVKGAATERGPPAGASAEPAAAAGPGTDSEGTTMPLKNGVYELSSPFGPRGGEQHQGTDFSAPLGTPIYAAHEGKVTASGPASGFGNWIIVDFDEGKSSNVYGHMQANDLKVKVGDTVKAGQQIAAVGNEGQSSGPHLHFELWQGGTRLQGGHAVNPMPWLRGANQPSGQGADVTPVAAVNRGNGCGDVGTGTSLKPGSVPAAFEPWIIKAGTVCPEISAPLIAAQTHQESGGFQVQATNPDSGAAGPGQFMAATWAAKGVDGDDDGKKDIYSIADSMMAMAHYDCELLAIMRDEMSAGKVKGDLVELTLSAYNCGPGATLSAGGPCQNGETQHYIKIIPMRARTVYANPNADAAPVSGAGFGGRVVAAAMKWRGTTYAWGGGTGKGPSKGITDGGVADSFGDFNKIGFDCSGLVIHGVYQASGGKIELPHYTVAQLNDKRGKPVSGGQSAWAPGDVLFPAGGNPQHVAIYIGDGKVVEAPQSGDVVKVSPVQSAVGANPDARRFG